MGFPVGNNRRDKYDFKSVITRPENVLYLCNAMAGIYYYVRIGSMIRVHESYTRTL